MSAHTHTVLTPGCYRCDLNVDEIVAALEDASRELVGMREARDLLDERCKELETEIRGLQESVDNYDRGAR